MTGAPAGLWYGSTPAMGYPAAADADKPSVQETVQTTIAKARVFLLITYLSTLLFRTLSGHVWEIAPDAVAWTLNAVSVPTGIFLM